MRFLTDQTSIPVPFILHSGTKGDIPLGLSPFVMMEYIEHDTKMYDALNRPGCPKEERGILDPSIDEDRLEMLYGQLAGIQLQLSRPSIPRIGSLSQNDDLGGNTPAIVNEYERPCTSGRFSAFETTRHTYDIRHSFFIPGSPCRSKHRTSGSPTARCRGVCRRLSTEVCGATTVPEACQGQAPHQSIAR